MSDIKKTELKSEFNMTRHDFERYTKILVRLDELDPEIHLIPTSKNINAFRVLLWNLFKNWSPIIFNLEIYEALFKESVKYINENKLGDAVNVLDEIHIKLLDLRQQAGFGLFVQKKISESTKMKRGFGGKK